MEVGHPPVLVPVGEEVRLLSADGLGEERQLEAFVVASDLPKSPGHPFCTALNRLLAENGFDTLAVKLFAPC